MGYLRAGKARRLRADLAIRKVNPAYIQDIAREVQSCDGY